mmetsp:Transcript_36584/g.62284  ORF Transcript_36584/g.62284 Transcript_36584/m.62284 type:complete len:277 (+) Transcript_36584:141-971(+)|eukprot:CAMPEP_0183740914 /NCGR_PEP_ID=MMETSP0737-20130205/60819_1 /TAXON_ID=385413 /ORGANISM="Thalassiosira miniscula, Strain CCMP1093" /LENGTH=276 /DNA_ID=CAMNT_0025976093 /DNA_START=78 /DNA_END=908 /DNA_ORIENTATION=-
MISHPKHQVIALLLLACSRSNEVADAFAPSLQPQHPLASTSLAAEGFAPSTVKERPSQKDDKVIGESSMEDMSADDAKQALIDLIPRMTGKDEEYRAVESYVNLLEEKYSSIQTLDFLNLAMCGEWQLLFSTNLLGRPNRQLRLRELVQKIEADGFNGSLTNMAQWDYAEDETTFDAYGNFNVKCSYSINQGARMVVDLENHEIRPAKGSKIPKDVPKLVGMLNRAIPKEIFDPNGHALDTTYLDADLRIVRLTGPNHEGVRNIFMRKGSLEINPV